jgi:hypothetical protein
MHRFDVENIVTLIIILTAARYRDLGRSSFTVVSSGSKMNIVSSKDAVRIMSEALG